MKAIKKTLAIILFITLIIQQFFIFSNASVSIDYPEGDANLDYSVTIDDARAALRFATKRDEYTKAHVIICDVNGNGKLDVTDVRIILRFVIGIDTDTLNSKKSVDGDDFSEWIYRQKRDLNKLPTPSYTLPYVNKKSGTFFFYVYGYGHGVGMSQYGAVALSNINCDYSDILTHYFTGTKLKKTSVPTYTYYCGSKVKTKELIARIVYQEIYGIATGANDIEALKAQAVCAFTILKYYNFSVSSKWTAGVASDKSYSELPASLKKACNAVYGYYLTQIIDSSCKPILAVYSGSVGGATASSDYIWGTHYSYLQSVRSPLDLQYSSTISVRTFTKTEMKNILSNYGYDVSSISDPSKWIQIIDHTASVNQSTGYVTCVKIGNKYISNSTVYSLFYEKIGLRSSCFSVEYVP